MSKTQTRRHFLTSLPMAGAVGVLPVSRSLAAEGALEITTVRLPRIPATCLAPQYIAEQLLRLAAAGACKLAVFAEGLVTRGVAIVPVTIEDRSIRQCDHAPMSASPAQTLRAFHPKRVLAFELRQILRKRPRRIIAREQPDHLEEERRL